VFPEYSQLLAQSKAGHVLQVLTNARESHCVPSSAITLLYICQQGECADCVREFLEVARILTHRHSDNRAMWVCGLLECGRDGDTAAYRRRYNWRLPIVAVRSAGLLMGSARDPQAKVLVLDSMLRCIGYTKIADHGSLLEKLDALVRKAQLSRRNG
jgi:hypothetical protein